MRWQDRMAVNRFTVLGRVSMDLYADPPGMRIEAATGFVTALGGSAGNIAAALARQGAEVAMLTCVSGDAVGRFCRAELARYGVSDRFVREVQGGARTSLAVVETRPADAQTVLYRNNAADFALTEADVAGVDFADQAALIVTGTALAVDPSRSATLAAMARARAAGAVVVLDIDWRAYSWRSSAEARAVCTDAAHASDIVIGNDEEFALMAGDTGLEFARELGRASPAFCVYKMGAEGCLTITPDREFRTGIYPVQAKKPMGAGDGFMGGLMAGLAHGHPLPEAVRRGAATAAIIVSGIGCAPASPDTAALDAFLATHSPTES